MSSIIGETDFFLLTFLNEAKHLPNLTVTNSQKIYDVILFVKQKEPKVRQLQRCKFKFCSVFLKSKWSIFVDVKTNLKVYLFRKMKTVSRVVTQKEIMQFY